MNGRPDGIPPLFHHLGSETKSQSEPEAESALDKTELRQQEPADLDVSLGPKGQSSEPIEPPQHEPVPQPSQTPALSPWQAELVERVQEYRQRRSHLHKDKEEEGHKTLNFDFGASPPKTEEPRRKVIEFPSVDEVEKRSKPGLEIQSGPEPFGLDGFGPDLTDDDEIPAPPLPPQADPRGETGPLEIELGPPGNSSPGIEESAASAVPIAQMNMRFFAGLIDALVLLAGAAIYGLIFWRFAGSFSPNHLDLVVAAAVGAFFLLLYFAGCTAMAGATPGLIWAGLEVITFEGDPPRLSHCLWRGFGYLVSTSALLLGFVWAVVDAEGLTWHDRISRTFVVPAEHT